MKQFFSEIRIRTRGRGLYEITDDVYRFVRQSEVKNGLVTLNIQHTSASLVVQENADPDVRRDLEKFFAELVPDASPLYSHTIEGPDDMSAHIRASLTNTTLSFILKNGELTLGTWQGIYVWEHREVPHSRIVLLHIIGE